MQSERLLGGLLVFLLLFFLVGRSVGQLTVTDLTASGKADATYSWKLDKTLTSSPSVSIDIGATATANYHIVIDKTIATQTVQVDGSFKITNSGTSSEAVPQTLVTFSTAPSGFAAPSPTCASQGTLNPGDATACTFTAKWSDTSLTAAQTGQVTVSGGSSLTPASTGYSITGGSSSTGTGPDSCATLNDNFVITSGSTTVPNSVVAYNPNPNGIQLCDKGDYKYTVTFGKFDVSVCGTDVKATNTATLKLKDGSVPQSQSETLNIALTGCVGGTASISGVKTTVINTYTWALTKTGGGSGLTTDPSRELSIPFTITATQNGPTVVGYVAGSVSVVNTVSSSTTIAGLTVTIAGQNPQTVSLSSCGSTTLAAQGSTTCSFNVTNSAAPAAGTVTATVTFSGNTGGFTSSAQSFDYSTAETYNLGGTATIYDNVDASGLSTLLGTGTGLVASLYRFDPADQHPPTVLPGVTLDGSRVFQYNMIVSRLGACVNTLTVTNTATLTPGGGSSQGSLTATASATFSVTGCNVLPTLSLTNMQTWAAVTWSWQMTKTASPSQIQLPPGQGGTANYQVQLTRTRQTGNYWLSGTITVINPATYPMYISGVSLVGSSGSWGQPANCLGGSNIGATSGVPITGLSTTGLGTTVVSVPASTSGRFLLAAGAQVTCVFNVTTSTGAPPQGTVQAIATTSTLVVTSAGNAAQSDYFPVNFASPTQQWDIGGCVSFSDSATTQGSAGAWVVQLTGLPQQQQICESRTWTYSGSISPVPATGAICNQPLTIVNNAQAMPVGGGSTVTASATIQVSAVNCPTPTPAPGPVGPPVPSPPSTAPASLQPLVVTVNPGVAAGAGNSYVWAVALTSSPSQPVIMLYSDTRQVQYTVMATRTDRTSANTVTGQVTVANPNTSPVSANAVSVTLSGSTTPVTAQCPSPLPAVIPAGGNIVCSFSATAPTADAGTVSAAAVSSAGSSTSTQSVPYTFPAAGASGSQGSCAVLSDQIAPLPIFTGTSLALSQNRPPGNDVSVCDDTTYTFTATFGPFTKSNCGVQTVVASAAANPVDGPQKSNPPAAQSTLNLEIKGCQSVQAASEVGVVVDQPEISSTTRTVWKGFGSAAEFLTKISYDQTAELQYNMTWQLVQEVTSSLSGNVTVNNPTSSNATLQSVYVSPEITASNSIDGAIPVAQATCPRSFIGSNSQVQCTYTSVFKGAGRGNIAAQAMLQTSSGANRTIQSDGTAFSITQQASTASQKETCAEIITGLTMGSALLVPGAAGAVKYSLTRVCQSGSIVVKQPVGPFTKDDCGKHTVVSVMRVRPLTGRPSVQEAFAVITTAQVQVTGCPLTVTPKPVASIAPGIIPSKVVAYDWTVGIDGDAPKPLTVQYDQSKDVVVTASVQRSQGMRSVSVQGSVQLESQGKSTLSVYKVQAAGMARTGELMIVNTTCPSDSMVDGKVSIPPPQTGKVLCSFNISNLPPMDGPVMALVYVDRRAKSPLPTVPGIYRVAQAPRVLQGECVQVGTSRSFTKAGAVASLAGQPAASAGGLPTTPICRSVTANNTLTFGPFESAQCGKYTFTADVSADLSNSPVWRNAEYSLNVNVVGCK